MGYKKSKEDLKPYRGKLMIHQDSNLPIGRQAHIPERKLGVLSRYTNGANKSGEKDSNLRPPASRAGKQPPLSPQLATLTGLEPVTTRETVGHLTSQ